MIASQQTGEYDICQKRWKEKTDISCAFVKNLQVNSRVTCQLISSFTKVFSKTGLAKPAMSHCVWFGRMPSTCQSLVHIYEGYEVGNGVKKKSQIPQTEKLIVI